jgi:NADH-quinone oxidoreductase subunit J
METVSLILFFCLAAAALASGIFVIAHRNPMASVFSLVVNAVCVAGIFLLLGDAFLAAIQVIVYAGAILVLFLFVVMLLDVRRDELFGAGGRLRRVLLALFVAALGLAIGRGIVSGIGPGAEGAGTTAGVPAFSDLLFQRYLLPFEVVSMLLLAAMLGVVVLTMRSTRAGEAGGEKEGRA